MNESVSRVAATLFAVQAALLSGGCLDRNVAAVDLVPEGELVNSVPVEQVRDLDLLFVVDNSLSMEMEQASLTANFFRIVEALRTTSPEGLPSLHIGVVTTDVGAGAACNRNPQRGQLIGRGRNCQGPNGRFIRDVARPDGSRERNYSGSLEDTFSCIASVGTDGCGFEQPLEAMRLALSTDRTGFLRPNAYLAVVFITDEDDCSTFDPRMFEDGRADLDSHLGPRTSFRCFEFGVQCDGPSDPRTPGTRENCRPRENSPFMADPTDYAEFIRQLKPFPNQVLMASIAGPEAPVNVIREFNRNRQQDVAEVEFLCEPVGGRRVADAAPPIRLNAFLDRFANNLTRTEICNPDLSGSVQRIADFFGQEFSRCIEGVPADTDPLSPGLQPTCRVAESRFTPGVGLGESHLPACDRPGQPAFSSELPCYVLEEDRAECPDTETGLALKVTYSAGVNVPPGTQAVARCDID